MLARLHSATFSGIEAGAIEVEIDVAHGGLASTVIVGLPDIAVRESIERVRTAMTNSGYEYPRYKTVVNLAPADLRKEGPSFDLPIALGIVFASGEVIPELTRQYLVMGELALDGRIRPVHGVLSAAMLARQLQLKGVVVPTENAPEAAVVADIEVIPVSTLTEAIGFLSGQLPIESAFVDVHALMHHGTSYEHDFGDVRGQEAVKRALTVAAAGMHNVLMIGPPGSGKTMLAKRIPSILPPLTLEESLETTRVHSVAGELKSGLALLVHRPVRTPHHSASTPALVGGGTHPQAGEVSLAHHGVLFLDEFPEFSRPSLEALRQPLEDGEVTIARAQVTVRFPASFMLVAAMNPCPCGYFSDPRRACKCSAPQIDKYVSRISGPLVDRIDIHVEVPAVPFAQLRERQDGTTSEKIRADVMSARSRQQHRMNGQLFKPNARLGSREIRKYCPLDDAGELILRQAMTELKLSARAHDKVLRVARTIADLEGAENVRAEHVSEAIHYRRLDRQT